MAGLLKRRHDALEPDDAPETVDMYARMFTDRATMWPFRRRAGGDVIRIDEFREDGTLVVRAELPGIDPENDVEVTVASGTLRIEAERREEEKIDEKGYLRRELRYGCFTRLLALPVGVTEADVTASYRDGILEVRVSTPEPEPEKKIPVRKV